MSFCSFLPFVCFTNELFTFLQFLCDARNLFGTKKDSIGPLLACIFNLVNVSLKTFIILHYCSKFEIFMMTYSAIVELFIHQITKRIFAKLGTCPFFAVAPLRTIFQDFATLAKKAHFLAIRVAAPSFHHSNDSITFFSCHLGRTSQLSRQRATNFRIHTNKYPNCIHREIDILLRRACGKVGLSTVSLSARQWLGEGERGLGLLGGDRT